MVVMEWLTDENGEYGDELGETSLAIAHSLSKRRGSNVAAIVSTRTDCAVSSIEAAAATDARKRGERRWTMSRGIG